MRPGDLTRLFHFPGLLQAIVGGAIVLGLVSATGTLFLSATASATMQRLAEEGARERVPAVELVVDSSVSADVLAYRHDLLRRELAGLAGAPVVTARGDAVTLRSGDEDELVRILSRTDALEHVHVVDEASGEGVWLADFTARDLGVEAGDRIEVSNLRASATVRIAGIYRDIYAQPRTPYWAPLDDFIYPAPGADTRPPLFMLMDLEQYLALEEQLLDDQDVISWEFPIDTGPASIQATRAYATRLARLRTRLSDSATELGASFPRVSYAEPVSGWLSRSEAVVGSIRGPVETLAIAARGVALVVLAGAGVFVIGRRRVELAVLHARGIGPLRLGVRAAAEALLPVAIGAAAGWGVAIAATRALEPLGVVSAEATREAAVAVVVTAAVAVVLLGVVSATAAREQTERGSDRVRRVSARFPWELVALVLAGVAFWGLRAGGTGGAGATGGLDRFLLLFPILAIAGGAGIVARGFQALVPSVRRLGSRWSPAPFLASRRLAAAPRSATSLVVASALAVGILTYAATLGGSVRATAELDAALLVGSEVAVRHSGEAPDLDGAPFPATAVARLSDVALVSGEALDVDVLAIDPATFAGAASWRPEFADASLEDLLARIGPGAAERVPMIAVGSIGAAGPPVLDLPGSEIPVEVVARARAFPGRAGQRPLLVANARSLDEALVAAGTSLDRVADATEVWALASDAEARAFLADRDAGIVSTLSADELRSTPRYLALTSMFRLLEALGIVSLAVMGIGATLYLSTRQRRGEAAYALARRMGLTRGSHRRSVALELAGLLLASLVIGAALAVVSALVVNAEVQARSAATALPLFRAPWAVVGAVAAALAVLAALSAAAVQRRADRSDVVEVMRLAE